MIRDSPKVGLLARSAELRGSCGGPGADSGCSVLPRSSSGVSSPPPNAAPRPLAPRWQFESSLASSNRSSRLLSGSSCVSLSPYELFVADMWAKQVSTWWTREEQPMRTAIMFTTCSSYVVVQLLLVSRAALTCPGSLTASSPMPPSHTRDTGSSNGNSSSCSLGRLRCSGVSSCLRSSRPVP